MAKAYIIDLASNVFSTSEAIAEEIEIIKKLPPSPEKKVALKQLDRILQTRKEMNLE